MDRGNCFHFHPLAHAEEEIGEDKEEAETEDTGKAEGEEECWLHPDWIVGQTVEEVVAYTRFVKT